MIKVSKLYSLTRFVQCGLFLVVLELNSQVGFLIDALKYAYDTLFFPTSQKIDVLSVIDYGYDLFNKAAGLTTQIPSNIFSVVEPVERKLDRYVLHLFREPFWHNVSVQDTIEFYSLVDKYRGERLPYFLSIYNLMKANYYINQEEYQLALPFIDSAIASNTDNAVKARAYRYYAILYERIGKIDSAEFYLQKAQEILIPNEDIRGHLHSLLIKSKILFEKRDIIKAFEIIDSGYNYAAKHNDTFFLGHFYELYGDLSRKMKRNEMAITKYMEALSNYEKIKKINNIVNVSLKIYEVLQENRMFMEASSLLNGIMSMCLQQKDSINPFYLMWLPYLYASTLIEINEYENAQKILSSLYSLLIPMEDTLLHHQGKKIKITIKISKISSEERERSLKEENFRRVIESALIPRIILLMAECTLALGASSEVNNLIREAEKHISKVPKAKLREELDLYLNYIKFRHYIKEDKILAASKIAEIISNALKSSSISYKNAKIFKEVYDFYVKNGAYKEAVQLSKVILEPFNSFASYESFSNIPAAFYTAQLIKEIKTTRELREAQAKLLEEQKAKYNSYVLFAIIGIVVTGIYLVFYRKKWKQVRQQNEIIDKQRKELASKTRELMLSMSSASIIQSAMMNDKVLKNYFSDYFILHLPRDYVSGDFYWTCSSPKGDYIVIGDATGHGVPGAILTVLLIQLFEEAIKSSQSSSPGEILSIVRDMVISTLEGRERLEGMEGILMNPKLIDGKIQIRYASSRFKPVMFNQNNGMMTFDADIMPISRGWEINEKFRDFVISPPKDSVIYIFSDGFKDQIGGDKGRGLGKRKFFNLLGEIYHLPCAKQKEKLLDFLNKWKNNYPQIDDILVVGIKL